MRQVSAFALDQVLDLLSLSVAPHTPLAEAICQMGQTSIRGHLPATEETDLQHSLLAEPHTSCVLVLDNTQLVGILTQRDIVRLIAEHQSLAELAVEDGMSRHVITLKAEDNLDVFSVLDLMRHHQIRHLPLVDDQGTILGVLTPRRLRSLLEPADLMKLRQVHEVMTSTFIHAVPTDPVQQITQMMVEHQASCVVIVETMAGSTKPLYPIGILTERDIIKCQQQELNLERTQAQDAMSTPLFLVSPEDSLWTAHTRMEHYKVRHLVVADLQGKLKGIVTQSDLLPRDQEEIHEVLELLQRQVQDLQAEYVKLQQEQTDDLVREANIQKGVRKRLDSKLRDANQRLTFHVENSPLAVIEWDSQFRVQRWSQQSENIFGWSTSEVLGKHWTDWHFVFEGDLDAVMEITGDLLTGREPRNISQSRHYTKEGLVIDCEWYHSALLDDSDHLISILSLAQDVTARKQLEETQKISEERLQLALEGSGDGLWDWDITTNEVYLSPQWLAMLDYEVNELPGHVSTWESLIHPKDKPWVMELLEAHLQDGEAPYTFDYRMRTKSGEWKWIANYGKVVVRDHDGTPLRMSGTHKDVSNRKQAEVELRQQALIFERIQDGVILTDSKGCIIDWNPAAETMFGYAKAEILGQTPGILHRPEGSATLTQQILDGMTREGQWSGEITFIRKDGTIGICETVVVPLLNPEGQLKATIGLSHDITHRKKADKQIHEQAALLDITTDATMVRSLEHQILFWNQGAERLYGWKAKDVIGRNVNDLLYQEPLAPLEDIQNALSEKGEWQGELQQVTHTGQEIVVDSRWTLMRDDNRQPSSILVVNTDITEKKQLEAQYLRAQRLESIGTLAGGIAHDLNNILTPIVGIAGLLPLKIRHLDEQSQHLIEMLQISAHRGADLVQQVLSFSRGIEDKRIILQVGHLISEVKDFAEKAFPKNIELHINLPSDLEMVNGDASQLHQMLMNLCVNARDAMPYGGNLSLSAKNLLIDEHFAQMHLEAQVGPYIVITVADTGVGMALETLERIFDPFFTTKEVGSGTGLGLSTLMGIVKSHRGFVKVDSQLGRGTQFSVYLPAVEDSSPTQTETLECANGLGEVILVVDDEAPIREIAKATLEAHNYTVITAQSGIEAIAQYVQCQDDIDAVLMDMMMPEMDGTKAIQTLKAMDPQIKIIVATGLVSREQNPADTNLEVDAFLSKPYTAATLLNALKGVLNHSQ
ncbi:PAS domain S-box protein [Acaryochloris marina NIES-2412]|uniref:PAS domain S-box protein n=1 Tax=Acaryochloris marina TaxID=155978 RepID=UPI004059CF20